MKLISGENAPRGEVQVVARHEWDLPVFTFTSVMGTLTSKTFNALRTPIPVREMVNPVFVDLSL